MVATDCSLRAYPGMASGGQASDGPRVSPSHLPAITAIAFRRICGMMQSMPAPSLPRQSFRSSALLVVALVTALGCHRSPSSESELEPDEALTELLREPPAAPEPEEPSPRQWTIQSPDGRWVLRQKAADGEGCTLRAVERDSGATAWESDVCLATREQVRLLSPSGDRVMVLLPAPSLDMGAVGDIEVGFIAERGEVVRRFVAREFIDVARFEIVDDGLSWVARGVNGVLVQHRGHAVELTLAGNRQAIVSFDGGVEVSNPIVAAAPVEDAARPVNCPASVACSYVDSSGVFHVVESGTQVPERYRDRARPLGGDITAVGETTSLDDIALPPAEDPWEPPPPPVRRDTHSVTAPSTPDPAIGEGNVAEAVEETVMQRAIRLGTRAGAPLPGAYVDPDSTPRYESDREGRLVPIR